MLLEKNKTENVQLKNTSNTECTTSEAPVFIKFTKVERQAKVVLQQLFVMKTCTQRCQFTAFRL